MIKVLHVTGTMNRGGAEVMIMDIYRNVSSDFSFSFLINYDKKTGIIEGDFDDEIKNRNGELYHIPTQWGIGPFNYLKEFKKIIKESNPDIVHIHMNSKSGIIAWAAKKAGAKVVITHAHADIKFRGNFLYKKVSEAEMKFQKVLIDRYSDYFWGCSVEANKSLYYASKLNNQNSAVINNAVDVKAYQNIPLAKISALRDSYIIEDQTLVIGNVGRIVRHKNVLFVIDILNALVSKGVDCVFVFAGRADQSNYMEEINAKIEQYDLKDQVKYLGLRDDIPTVMNTFDVFVGPALKEGFGLVAVEAQAAGVPCVLYTGFPRSVDMHLELVSFLDNFAVDQWVERILKMKDRTNANPMLIKEKIIALGFDSDSNTHEIEKRYLEMLEGRLTKIKIRT